MSQNINGVACINGEIMPLDSAKISLSDRGLLFGHSLFETVLIKKDEFVNWELHFQRLVNGCKKIFITPPNELELKNQCERLISAFNVKYASDKKSLKIIISGGYSFDISDYNPMNPCNIYIICRSAPNHILKPYRAGIKLKSFKDERSSFLIDVKTCNYLFNFMCLQEAKNSLFDDVLFKDSESFYTECATSSLIWFDKNFIVHCACLLLDRETIAYDKN